MQAHTSIMAPRCSVSLVLLVRLHAAIMLLTCMSANGDGTEEQSSESPSSLPSDGSSTLSSKCDPPEGESTLSVEDLCACKRAGYPFAFSSCPDEAPPPKLPLPVDDVKEYGATTAGTVNAVVEGIEGACAKGPAAIERKAVFDPCCLVAPNAALATKPFTNVPKGTVCLPQVTHDLADVEGRTECCAWAYTPGADPPQMSPEVQEDLAVNDELVDKGTVEIDRAKCSGKYDEGSSNGSHKLSEHGVAAVLVATCAFLATAVM